MLHSVFNDFFSNSHLEDLETFRNSVYTVLRLFPCGFVSYIITVGKDGKEEVNFEFANDKFYEILGHTPEQFAEKDYKLFSLLGKKNRSSAVGAYKRAMLYPGESFKSEHNMYTYDKREIYVESYISRIILDNYDYLICTFADITDRYRLEERFKYLSERNRIIMHIAEELIFEYDIQKDSIEISEKYADSFAIPSYEANFFKTGSIKELIHPDDLKRITDTLWTAKDKLISGSMRLRIRMRDKRYYWFSMIYSSMLDSEGDIVKIIGRLRNINEEMLSKEKMEDELLLDPMTKLLNKSALKQKADDFFNDKRNRNKKHAVLVIDIDNFKHVNDTLGHMVGDVVIENIANTIRKVIREDDIAGRAGGDEFVIILKDVSPILAESKAERINRTISEIYVGENQNFKISTSIGISMYKADGADYDTLFKKADSAMYFAKNNGKDGVAVYNREIAALGDKQSQGRFDTAFDYDLNNYAFDTAFIQYAFTLFLNTRSIDATINILMEKLGERYDFSAIALSENSSNEDIVYETNRWVKNVGIVTRGLKINRKNKWKSVADFKVDQLNVIEDCTDETKLCKEDIALFKENGYKSISACMVSRPGFVEDLAFFFFDTEHNRHLSDYDKETIYQFCLTMSYFISIKTGNVRSKAELEKLYMFDRLTGVNNIEVFMIKGADIIKKVNENNYCALAYADIMGFAHVNESLGFEAGDNLLINFASIISSEPTVECVCRVHSDLFACIFLTPNKDEFMKAIDRIAARYYEYQNHCYSTAGCRINVGIYHIDSPDRDMASAFDFANLARKNAKLLTGRHISFFSEEMRNERNMEQDITSSLAGALEAGDIKAYLQPKVDMRVGQVVGAETLIRWNDGKGGVNLPDTFIPALEKHGSIVELDFFAFEETLKLLRKWKYEERKPIRVSVNFSRKHNALPNFIERVVSLTEKYGIDPKEIEIEVTESCLAADSRIMYKNLEKLKAMGYVISMDDFGTGYSSLDILLSSPVDVIKIDKSFLYKLGSGELSKEYIVKICELIRTTGREIVFEGVENQEQVDFLLENGVYMGQGFFFNRAIPPEEFETLYL